MPKKETKETLKAAYSRKKDRLKQQLAQKKIETEEKVAELEQEAKIAKLAAKVINTALSQPAPEQPVVTIQVTNTQDSQPQPLTPFTVLQRRQQREAAK